MQVNEKRSFWKYCLSGFPLAIILAIFIVLCFLAYLDHAPALAYIIWGGSGAVAIIAGLRDWKKNG